MTLDAHDTPDFSSLSFGQPALGEVEFKQLPRIVVASSGDVDAVVAHAHNVAYVEHIVTSEQLAHANAVAADAPVLVGLVLRCETHEDVALFDVDSNTHLVGAVTNDPTIAELLRTAFIPFHFEGTVAQQVIAGASRIVGMADMVGDFRLTDDGDIACGPEARFVLDRQIPVLAQPAYDREQGAIEQLGDHPLPVLQSMGFKVAIDELSFDFVEAHELSAEDVYRLILGTVDATFLPYGVREHMIETVLRPHFSPLIAGGEAEVDAVDEDAPETPDTHALLDGVDPQLLIDMGIEPKDLGLN
ncbi:MAG: hypothetical protein Q4A31_11385 [Corynebacterium sp.]|uniref:hypothetical protein n=1 Tax=Corynebacterium sp. TaxID=1720 RepID=UPI0026DBB321|nr:hypothetical protein [Corynebacterium sp.]MDO4762514.1 hypothetical protein [Corynebacterium sp.]